MTFGMQEAHVDNDGILHCPQCRCNNLHQRNTTIFERPEDARTTIVIAQNGDSVQATEFPSNDTCNPSERRQGLIIEFRCESCHSGESDAIPLHRLAILQHKGYTYVEWL